MHLKFFVRRSSVGEVKKMPWIRGKMVVSVCGSVCVFCIEQFSFT